MSTTNQPNTFFFQQEEQSPPRTIDKAPPNRIEIGGSNAIKRNIMMAEEGDEPEYRIVHPFQDSRDNGEEVVWVPGKKQQVVALPMLDNYKGKGKKGQTMIEKKEEVVKKQVVQIKPIADMFFSDGEDEATPEQSQKIEKIQSPPLKRKIFFENDVDDEVTEQAEMIVPTPVVIKPAQTKQQALIVKPLKIEKASSSSSSEQQQQEQKVKEAPTLSIIKLSDISNRRLFLNSPIPKNKILQCCIKRDKSGFGVFYPQYDMYLSEECKYLMTGKKRSGSATSNYLISADRNDLEVDSPNYMGKVRSNFAGTYFDIFNDGCSPKKPEPHRKIRKLLSSVCYDPNLFGKKGPRRMQVFFPNPEVPSQTSQQKSLKQQYQGTGRDNIKCLINKQPRWNDQLKVYVLNFKGRVNRPSVKNFILVQDNTEQPNIMLFGRIGDDVFNIDVSYPLSPIQAFGIAISCFDFKLACQ